MSPSTRTSAPVLLESDDVLGSLELILSVLLSSVVSKNAFAFCNGLLKLYMHQFPARGQLKLISIIIVPSLTRSSFGAPLSGHRGRRNMPPLRGWVTPALQHAQSRRSE